MTGALDAHVANIATRTLPVYLVGHMDRRENRRFPRVEFTLPTYRLEFKPSHPTLSAQAT